MATVNRNNDTTLTVTFSDGKEATFKQPNKGHLKHALAAVRKDIGGFSDVLVANCLVKGDKNLTENLGYLKQLNEVADQVFGKVGCTLTWLEGKDEALVEFMDDKIISLKPATRAIYSAAQVKARQNPLLYMTHILTSCQTDGDNIEDSPGHLLGFAEVADEFLEYTGEKLKN